MSVKIEHLPFSGILSHSSDRTQFQSPHNASSRAVSMSASTRNSETEHGSWAEEFETSSKTSFDTGVAVTISLFDGLIFSFLSKRTCVKALDHYTYSNTKH